MIDDTEIVFDRDSAEFTSLCANAAADAGGSAILARISALLGVVAADDDLGFFLRNQFDQFVGAGLDAGTAAGAFAAPKSCFAALQVLISAYSYSFFALFVVPLHMT